MLRTCYHCGLPGGTGKRELRPYGPGGVDVCAECVLGDKAHPERENVAKQEPAKRFLHTGPLILDPSEQSGPRRASEHETGRKN